MLLTGHTGENPDNHHACHPENFVIQGKIHINVLPVKEPRIRHSKDAPLYGDYNQIENTRQNSGKKGAADIVTEPSEGYEDHIKHRLYGQEHDGGIFFGIGIGHIKTSGNKEHIQSNADIFERGVQQLPFTQIKENTN
jgi:hypothetical protein